MAAHARRRVGRWPWMVAAVTVVATAVVAAVSVARNEGDSAGVVEGDPGIAHVHGLGVNPADGMVYVATHHGLYRLSRTGGAERVSNVYQDTMGFTVAGRDRFLASGHPDITDKRLRVDGKPPLLGLIESTDAGRTWRSLSLLGEADFHALAVQGATVYGWNASTGALLASTDRRTWEERSLVDLASFAVDPATPEHLVAATPNGVVDSVDGGRTWRSLGDGPAVAVVTWSDDGLVGIDPRGTVHRRDETGRWTAAGTLPGPPQALAAHRGVLYAAANDGDVTGIYQSDDDGRTWKLRHRDQPA